MKKFTALNKLIERCIFGTGICDTISNLLQFGFSIGDIFSSGYSEDELLIMEAK